MSDQDIVLNHTEIRYNLLVSLEWDAAELYVDGLRKDFRYMSDYLYDVSDGQLRLDTIVMLDDGAIWSEADVRIRADNVHNPDAVVGGIHHLGDYPINMPRKWFGDQDDSRYYTYVRHPLMDELSDNYRTIAHEFGHYALGFYDEYQCTDGAGNPINCCTDVMNPRGNFGFMQYQYDRSYYGPFASEMSSDYLYQNAGCRTTDQWRTHDSSCWGLFEFYMEDPIDGIYVPIRKPHLTDTTERRTPGGLNYFPGPNDDPLDLDYDVGRLVRFASPVLPPAANVRSVRVKVDGAPVGGAAVWHEQTATGRMVEQGNTTDDGWIWVLGVDVTQDLVGAAGFGFAVVPPPLAASASLSDRVWLSGLVAPSTDDSVVLELQPVQGSFPMICEGRITDTGWEYALTIERPFSSEPQFDMATESGLVLSTQFESDANGYVTQMPDTAMVTGMAIVHALDDASQTFFLVTPFAFTDVQAASQLLHLTGPGGSVVASLDSSQSGLHTVLIVSSAYPVPMTGLAPDAVQVGDAHSLSVPPGITLTGSNSTSIYYAESDLAPISGYRVNETDLAVYHWNTGAGQWELVGGLVDTTLNIVATSITETGVYALFASQIPVDVEDDELGEILPYRFELSQNYPNPFNPVTTIEYSLPERSHVTIEVYNIIGQKIRTLVDREESAGSYTVSWNGTNSADVSVSTGVYLYRFQAGDLCRDEEDAAFEVVCRAENPLVGLPCLGGRSTGLLPY